MEFILDWMNVRTFGAIGAAAVLIFGIVRYRGYAEQWYDRQRHPPVGAAVGGEDIAADLNREQSVRLRSLHRRVSEEINQAQDQGLNVAGFQAAADAALALDVPRYRDAAVESLNRLRLKIPRRPEPLRPATLEDAADDALPTPKGFSPSRRVR